MRSRPCPLTPDGYHLSELNFPFKSLTCTPLDADRGPLRPCLGLSPFLFSTATAMLTVGGLLGSMLSDRVVRAKGLAGGIAWSAWLNLVGAAVMALSPHWVLLMLGRWGRAMQHLTPGSSPASRAGSPCASSRRS